MDVHLHRTGSLDVSTPTTNVHISAVTSAGSSSSNAPVSAIDSFLRAHNVEAPPSLSGPLGESVAAAAATTPGGGGAAELARSLDALDANEEASLEDRLERLEQMLEDQSPGPPSSTTAPPGHTQVGGGAGGRVGNLGGGVGNFEEWDARKNELEEKMRGLEQLLDSSNASDFGQTFGAPGETSGDNGDGDDVSEPHDEGGAGECSDIDDRGRKNAAGGGGAESEGARKEEAVAVVQTTRRSGDDGGGGGGDGEGNGEGDGGRGGTAREDGGGVNTAEMPRAPSSPRPAVAPAAVPSERTAFQREDAAPSVWEGLNALLREAGFGAVPLAQGGDSAPDLAMLRETLREVLAQFTRRGEVIQELILGSDMNKDRQHRAERSLHAAATDLDKTKQRLAQAEARILELREAREERQKLGGAEVGRLRKENAALAQKLAHSEHRVRAKEAVLSRLQEKLDAEIARDQSNRRRDRDLFQQLQQRGPRAGSKTDAKHLAVINVFEEQREALQKEVDFLRGEVRRLSTALRDKTNHIHRKDRADAWRTPAAGELLERLEAQRREHAEAAQGLARREQAMVRKAVRLERQLTDTAQRAAEVEEENANLKMELSSRPLVKDWRAAHRRIKRLEEAVRALRRRLTDSRGAQTTDDEDDELRNLLDPGHDFDKGTGEAAQLRRIADTRALMQRDKLDFKLGLHRVENLPHSTARDILKDVCRALGLGDAATILPSLRKMQRVLTAVPRMEKFIRDVCAFVFMHADKAGRLRPLPKTASGAASQPQQLIEDVVPTLRQWLAELQTLGSLKALRSRVAEELQRGTAAAGLQVSQATDGAEFSDDQMVHAVHALVELESKVSVQREAFETADKHLHDQPEVLLNRIVLHFQHLFGVKSVQGMFPKVNELYVFVSEMQNFMRVLRPMVGVARNSSVNACLVRVRQLLEERAAATASAAPSPSAGSAAGVAKLPGDPQWHNG